MRSEVQIFPGPPFPALSLGAVTCGAIAQLGERLLCKQEVVGSIPSGSTNLVGDCTAILSIANISSVRKQIRAFMLHKAWARVLSDIVKRRSFRANASDLGHACSARSPMFSDGGIFTRVKIFESRKQLCR